LVYIKQIQTPLNLKIMKEGIKISVWGISIQAIGLVLDIAHHLNIGIQTPEGLLTIQHTIILIGFLVTAVGVLKTWQKFKENKIV
jgi:hypothetical protein